MQALELYPGTAFPVTVIHLGGATVEGASGAIVTAQGVLLNEYSIETAADPRDHSRLYRWRVPPARVLPGIATVLTASKPGNYFHWMTEALPRIHLLQRAGVRLDEIDWFVVSAFPGPVQEETLSWFGIPSAKIIVADKNFRLRPRSLVAASFPGIPGDVPAWASDFLAAAAPRNSTHAAERRIYISRAGARGRRVRNEAQLLEALPDFKVFHPERLTASAQAGLFRSADIIVAPHGAALTNLVFCQPGTRVVELFGPAYANPCYRQIAEQRGLSYNSLGESQTSSYSNLGRQDMTVDPAALAALVYGV